MSWMQPYRDVILSEARPLLAVGFSYMGEDDTSMVYMNRDVSIKFTVEPRSDDLTVLVSFLSSDHPDRELYGLDIIMTVFYGRDIADLLEVKDEADRRRIVVGYVNFIIEQKQLFGEIFPLAGAYRAYIADAAEKIKRWLQSRAPDGTT